MKNKYRLIVWVNHRWHVAIKCGSHERVMDGAQQFTRFRIEDAN